MSKARDKKILKALGTQLDAMFWNANVLIREDDTKETVYDGGLLKDFLSKLSLSEKDSVIFALIRKYFEAKQLEVEVRDSLPDRFQL
jgi:hypothetical protein